MARKLVVEIVGDSSNLQRSFTRSSHSAKTFERDIGKASRGALAGSGIFKGLGQSLAFASGGFLAFASAGELLHKSIDAATEAATAQRQLAAQFKASGLDLRAYNKQIVDASLATSRLSGFTETELTDAFTQAFRGSQNVSVGLKIQAIAADVARGRHIELSQATIALTKAYGGQTTALRRLGIQVPGNLTKMRALEFVSRRFAGQAEAGTTAQQRFEAALHNTEVSLGSALLPSLTKYLDKATAWLDNTENQAKIQAAANKIVKTTGQVLHDVAVGFKVARFALKPLVTEMQNFLEVGRKVVGVFNSLKGAVKGIGGHLGIGDGPNKLGPGTSTIGENALGGGVAAATARAVADTKKVLGLHALLVRSQLALAKAQVTATSADDRRVLSEQARLIRLAISQTSNLKKRTKLYQQLAAITGQIRSIDDQAASDRNAAQQAILDARREELEKDKAHAQQELDLLRQRESTLKDRIKAIQSQFRDAIDTARRGIGDLFGGPVLQPTDAARRKTLGLAAPIGSDPRKVVADLQGQVAQARALQRDINRITRAAKGSLTKAQIKQLRTELEAQGLGAATQIHGLAGGGPVLQSFFKQFVAREKLSLNIAKTTMRAQLVTLRADKLQLAKLQDKERPIVVNIQMDKKTIAQIVTKEQQKTKKGTTVQKTGRNAGE